MKNKSWRYWKVNFNNFHIKAPDMFETECILKQLLCDIKGWGINNFKDNRSKIIVEQITDFKKFSDVILREI